MLVDGDFALEILKALTTAGSTSVFWLFPCTPAQIPSLTLLPIPHSTFHILVTDHRYFICYSSSMDTLCIQ